MALLVMHVGITHNGVLVHITVYCQEYLNVSAGFGRYLISCYNAGLLFYGVAVIIPRGKMKVTVNTTGFAKTYLLTMYLILCGVLLMWIIVPFDHKLMMMFPVFFVLGTAMGGCWPYVIRLIESITPVSGTISCVLIMVCGAGEILIIFLNGELIEEYGAEIQPIPVLILCVMGIPFLAFTLFIYRKYAKFQELATA